MSTLNSEAAFKFAKEVTITALEHSAIQIGHTPAKTAENIGEFYRTLVLELRKDTKPDQE